MRFIYKIVVLVFVFTLFSSLSISFASEEISPKLTLEINITDKFGAHVSGSWTLRYRNVKLSEVDGTENIIFNLNPGYIIERGTKSAIIKNLKPGIYFLEVQPTDQYKAYRINGPSNPQALAYPDLKNIFDVFYYADEEEKNAKQGEMELLVPNEDGSFSSYSIDNTFAEAEDNTSSDLVDIIASQPANTISYVSFKKPRYESEIINYNRSLNGMSYLDPETESADEDTQIEVIQHSSAIPYVSPPEEPEVPNFETYDEYYASGGVIRLAQTGPAAIILLIPSSVAGLWFALRRKNK